MATAFPVVLKGVVLKPSEGVILSPQHICAGLTNAGTDLSVAPDLAARLEEVQESFLHGI